ncbi:uncharacterized protein [Rutidosis leptorrhynchoides]|uniref:uncharacterized protein n=1 Tax=Rutidosis leptorrhynchoides TaxID=125765 RepID=UPI003A9982A6
MPPWKCMKEPYMLMSMLIPGPKSPGINIDVYLQPLIDELNEFWVGVNAYDAYRMEKFSLRAVLLWTINDFPAYGMLSGWSVKGYKACPICMNETSSQYLTHSRKVVYMGHRKFLICTHHWRKDKKNFDGEVDFGEPVIPKSGHEVLNDIDGAMDFSEPYRFDKKYSDDTRGRKKKSIFFKLPYWPDLKLRHNIDIMHVVKNVTESLTATLFNIKGKTKDTSKSREDLKDHSLKKCLHLQPHGNSFIMPMACFHFTKNEKHIVINLLKSIKFLDGFASNISRCIKKEEFQLSRMKSHDFYVFIQRVLPLSIRGCLTKEVRFVLYELSEFIQKLCARNVYLDVLEKQEAEIVVILCKLERLLPQSFFDIMIHLLIHLPYEAKLACPSQYRWMFPFERKMGVLKGYVKNNARPEGCIAERYLDNECLTFCSMYLNDVESAFNMTERNNERIDIQGQISVFSCKVRPLGSRKICAGSTRQQLFAPEIRILSHGPSHSVNQYSGCMVNGYRFHTQSREKNMKTQNSGVIVQGCHKTNIIDFYGILQEVLELEYLGDNKRVLVFKCDWFKIDDRNGLQVDKESRATSINTSRKWYRDQPYILASQAKQVFYVPDLKLGRNWHVVESSIPRALYDIPLEEVFQEQEPILNSGIDLNMDKASLTRGGVTVPLEIPDLSTIGGDCQSLDDEGFIDSSDLESSQEEEFSEDEDDCTDSE